MRRLNWCASTQPPSVPRVKVERFCGRRRFRVHLLGELRAIKTHYRFGENTQPCHEPDPCPFCAEPLWKVRREYFAPALVMDEASQLWLPIVAVFTQGAWRLVEKGGAGPCRGRLLDVWRVQQGGANTLKVRELSRIDPLVPAFDVEPHLLRLWFPGESDLPPVELPAPVPFTAEAAPPPPPPPDAEPLRFSDEARAKLRAYCARHVAEAEARPAETPPAAASPATIPPATSPPATSPPRRSMTPPADLCVSAAERRRLASLPAEDLTAEDAVRIGRVTDYVLAAKAVPASSPSPTNGHPANGKGGAE